MQYMTITKEGEAHGMRFLVDLGAEGESDEDLREDLHQLIRVTFNVDTVLVR